MHSIRRRNVFVLVPLFGFIGLVGASGMLYGAGPGDYAFGAALWAFSWAMGYIVWRMHHVTFWRGRVFPWPLARPRALRPGDIASVGLVRNVNGFGQRGSAPLVTLQSGQRLKLGVFFTPDRPTMKNTYANDVVAAIERFRTAK